MQPRLWGKVVHDVFRRRVALTEATGGLATKRRFFGIPESWIGWTSVGLAVLSFAAIFNRGLVGGFRGVFAGLILAGACALAAVIWKKERSILVWIPLVIGALAAVWTAAELLFPH